MRAQLPCFLQGSAGHAGRAPRPAEAPFELHIYPGTNDAFFNDTGANYNADAADAFERTVAWFRRYVV